MNIAKKVLKRRKNLEAKVADVLSFSFRRVNITKLVASLNARFPRSNVRFAQKRVKGLGTSIVVTGYCEYSSDKRSCQIVIQLCYDDPLVSLDISNPHIGLDIVASVLHEMTHREQHQSRKETYQEYTGDYLSDPDEIHAYSVDFAYQLYMRDLPLETKELPMLELYRTEFPDGPELRRLYRHILRNLELLNK